MARVMVFALAPQAGIIGHSVAERVLTDPVLMLDDVFAELDESRRHDSPPPCPSSRCSLPPRFDDVPEELTGNTVRISGARS
jgi:DNA replication and repair protein RecF